MKHRFQLSYRLSAVFAVLLLACCAASVWLQSLTIESHEQEVMQRLSSGLAGHIASHSSLMGVDGLKQEEVRDLFSKLMDVNPSVEVYLLGTDGQIKAQAAPEGHLKRDTVDLAPIRRLIAGAPLPIFGDDPRSLNGRKVFSAAPLRVNGSDAGYVYVVLLGEEHDALAMRVARGNALRELMWSMALIACLGLLAGLAAFHWITRPLRQLTDSVHRFQANGVPEPADQYLAQLKRSAAGDEIASLRLAFAQMTRRIAEQWRDLASQDQQRREMVANISHDLRTPLTSLHGYLETLRVKADTLSDSERRRYLDIALGQSQKVGRLAQELFELARLECGGVKLDLQRFSLPELLQDVFQKFELAAEARQQRLASEIAADLPPVTADLALIERVLTNLLDNAIRHTPAGGRVEVRLRRADDAVEVLVADDGGGIPERLKGSLFARPSFKSGGMNSDGGLGLVIVRRILQLHGSDIQLIQEAGRGAIFRFQLGTSGESGGHAGLGADEAKRITTRS